MSAVAHPSRAERRRERRLVRAAEECRRAYSPGRLLLRVLGIPFLAASVGLSIYIRTSDLPPKVAVADLVARGGCKAAAAVGMAPAYRGSPGYHAANDPDGDGVACDVPAALAGAPAEPVGRQVGGAKFLRP
jgi:hypothetical protein